MSGMMPTMDGSNMLKSNAKPKAKAKAKAAAGQDPAGPKAPAIQGVPQLSDWSGPCAYVLTALFLLLRIVVFCQQLFSSHSACLYVGCYAR